MNVTESDLKTKEEKDYFDYIVEHRNNVQKAFELFGKALCEELKVPEAMIAEQVEKHDESKFSTEEFEPYRQYFFPEKGEKKDIFSFQKAWTHHYSVNKHHPEFWVLNGMMKKMPDRYIIEMLLDWAAMSIKFKNNPSDWWNENKDDKQFHPETRAKVDELMELPIWNHPIFTNK